VAIIHLLIWVAVESLGAAVHTVDKKIKIPSKKISKDVIAHNLRVSLPLCFA
jgi:hypothetical protein